MVCSIGSGRMAAMARILAAESVSQTIAEDVGHQKLAAQYIYRELREADEANLLDEEDMIVFDLKPMTDPLNLVCCNACKKPLKDSQYAAHAELCKSLSFTEEIVLELDIGTGHKKPPRKERKKLLTAYANQATLVGERERLKTVGDHDTAVLSSHLHEQIHLTSSFPTEAKVPQLLDSKFTCYDGWFKALVPDIEITQQVQCRPQQNVPNCSCREFTDIGSFRNSKWSNKSLCIRTQEAFTCVEYLNGSSAGSGKTCNHVVRYQMPNELFIPKGLQENAMLSRTSSSRNISHEQFDDQQEKRETRLLPSVQTPNLMLAQSSEVCLDKSGGHPSFPLNNDLGPHRPPVGMLRTNYLSNPYSFTGNSEKPLVTMQLPKGSVPVI